MLSDQTLNESTFNFNDKIYEAEFYTIDQLGDYWTIHHKWHPVGGLTINLICFAISEKNCPTNIPAEEWNCPEYPNYVPNFNCLN